jgi:hypothetical protein
MAVPFFGRREGWRRKKSFQSFITALVTAKASNTLPSVVVMEICCSPTPQPPLPQRPLPKPCSTDTLVAEGVYCVIFKCLSAVITSWQMASSGIGGFFFHFFTSFCAALEDPGGPRQPVSGVSSTGSQAHATRNRSSLAIAACLAAAVRRSVSNREHFGRSPALARVGCDRRLPSFTEKQDFHLRSVRSPVS